MPASTATSLALVKKMTAFFAAQDGAQTKGELITPLHQHLDGAFGAPSTADGLKALIGKLDTNVRRLHSRMNATKTAEDNMAALRTKLTAARMTDTRKAALEKLNADTIKAFQDRDRKKATPLELASEKLTEAWPS